MAWRPDYATDSEVKNFVRIADDVDDAEIATAITAASRCIDDATGRQFGLLALATERFYVAEWDRHRPRSAWIIPIDDVATTTGMVVEVDGTAVTDYTLEPRNAVADGMVWTHLVFGPDAEASPLASSGCEVSVTAAWGWPAVPVTIKNACKLQTARFLARRDSPFGVAGSPADGSEIRLLARLDPDVALMVRAYRRVWGAA